MATATPDWDNEMAELSQKVEMFTGYLRQVSKRIDELEKKFTELSSAPREYEPQSGTSTLADLRKSIGKLRDEKNFIPPMPD